MGSNSEITYVFPNMSVNEVERRVLSLCDLEKRRIGQDLHDSIGQQLTGINLMSKTIEHRLREDDHPAADSLKEIAEMLDKAINEIREVVAGMAPAEIQSQNAQEALDLLCQRVEHVHQIRCTLLCGLKTPLTDPDIVKNLYFVAAESINNAIRHGDADQIDVHLRGGTGRNIGELVIRNNGSFSEDDFNKPTGIGLSGMRCRAEALNGEISLMRYLDGFIAVYCTFTIPPKQENSHDNKKQSENSYRR